MNRHADGTFAHSDPDFGAIYAEIQRLDQLLSAEKSRLAELRAADQLAVAAALSAAEKAVAAALVASEKAVNKAEVAQGNVNSTQNEFRGSLRDQANLFMPRLEVENTVRELRGLTDIVANTANSALSREQYDREHKALASDVSLLRSRVDVGPPSLSALQSEVDERRGGVARIAGLRMDVMMAGSVIGAVVGFVVFIVDHAHP